LDNAQAVYQKGKETAAGKMLSGTQIRFKQITYAKKTAGPCTAKTTVYCANIAVGVMLAQFTKYLRLLPVDSDIHVNLPASEINVGNC
jgi:hypothetical protein